VKSADSILLARAVLGGDLFEVIGQRGGGTVDLTLYNQEVIHPTYGVMDLVRLQRIVLVLHVVKGVSILFKVGGNLGISLLVM
jgi:hypothetical protein